MTPKGQQTPNIKVQKPDKIQTPKNRVHVFDLEERMAGFGTELVGFCRQLKVDHVSQPIVSQLVRSATSVGANYSEANNASSRKDFRNKAYIAKKEVQETKHWLRMLLACYPQHKARIIEFWNEAHELTLILQSITNKLQEKAIV